MIEIIIIKKNISILKKNKWPRTPIGREKEFKILKGVGSSPTGATKIRNLGVSGRHGSLKHYRSGFDSPGFHIFFPFKEKEMIKYKSGYKYQLVETYTIQTEIKPEFDIITEYIVLYRNGTLTMKKGYAWDGPSGPTIDTKSFMRGSLVHDAFYQLMREGHLPIELRDTADRELQRMCIEDGMWRIRAWWVYRALKAYAKKAAMGSSRKEILSAP